MNKLTYEYVKKYIETEGYNLLSNEYKNNKTKLELQCPNGHKFKMNWDCFKRGQRCPTCKDTRFTYEYVKEYIESFNGYKLLSTEYKNTKSKLSIQCPEGHTYSVIFSSFRKGWRCPVCARLNRKLTYESVKEYIESYNYKLLSYTYVNSYAKLKIQCDKGHIYYSIFNNFKKGARCPVCARTKSKTEVEIYNLVKELYPDVVSNDRTLIKPFELDILIPSIKTAIEYDGLYWHSEQLGKDKNYHLTKLNMCNSIGWRLITIFEDEWINKNKTTKERLLYQLNKTNADKVFARKCVVKEIDATTARKFCNEYHLQSYCGCKVKLGLFYDTELISVMTFSKLSLAKGNKVFTDNEYELSRFCNNFNYIVIGGASKLFKYFIRNYKPKSIISFSDRRWSDGNLYKKLGFEFQYNTSPCYYYIIDGQRKHRFIYRKSELKNKLEIFDLKLTEYQNMLNNGFDRIWDCGNSKWLWR